MCLISADSRPIAIAHRGEPVGHCENTLPAIAAALRLGADLVEIDVKVTADDQVIVLHDDSLARLWNHSAQVRDLSWAQVSEITDGGVPLLRDALALIAGTGTGLLIDMDSDQWAGPSQAVVDGLIVDGVLTRDEVAWCGRTDSLLIIRDSDPAARILLSWDEGNVSGEPPPDDAITTLRAEAYNPEWVLMNEETVAWAHDRGMAASCWTVDDESIMRRQLDLGVSAIISNRIELLRR